MAHEVGHNFGSEHDGQNNTAYRSCDPKVSNAYEEGRSQGPLRGGFPKGLVGLSQGSLGGAFPGVFKGGFSRGL